MNDWGYPEELRDILLWEALEELSSTLRLLAHCRAVPQDSIDVLHKLEKYFGVGDHE